MNKKKMHKKFFISLTIIFDFSLDLGFH
jgi:hypothetical protein